MTVGADDKLAHYETLFPRQDRLDLGIVAGAAEAAAGDELKAAIGGVAIDFGEPPAVRLAAAAICGLADRGARIEALAAVPAAFRDTVRILVERAFYNRARGER